MYGPTQFHLKGDPVKNLSTPAEMSAAIQRLTLDAADNIILTGTFTGTVDFGGATPLTAASVDMFVAKYTLAANASRDAKLLAMLKSVGKYYPKDVKKELDEVTLAAETMDLAKLRKDALASIDDLKRKGPGSKRDVSLWGQIGEGALALGCIGAAAAGQVEFGIPCVVGGAVSSAGLHYWDTQN